jgi:membrane protein DedA with SNARE-associated domain
MSRVLEWVQSVAAPWGYVLIGGLALAESAAFVGLVIPGKAALLLGGFLAQRGQLGLPVMVLAAVLGAVVGDSIGYEIGRTVGPRLRRSRLGRRVGERRWQRAERFLAENGGRAVFVGRWVGLLRALVPTLAGMGRRPYGRFLPFNVLGGLTWAPTFVLLGYAAGSSYQRVERIAGRASLILAGIVLVVAGVVLAARWVAWHPDRVRAAADRLVGQRPGVRRLRARHARLLGWLGRRLSPGGVFGLELTAGLLMVLAAGWMFGELLDAVLEGGGLAGVDRPTLRFWPGTARRG